MNPKPQPSRQTVSPNNPCPFLRALVAEGLLPNDQATAGAVAHTVVGVARTGEGEPTLPTAAVYLIALLANGLSPLQVVRNGWDGVRLDALRGGPLDKRGVGSGIIDTQGRINPAELDRLAEFASIKQSADGSQEQGLDAAELERMMDANFARAADRRRKIDRKLMKGEWPVLLKVMGREGPQGRYLSLRELRELFLELRLPQRMLSRLQQAPG